MKQKLIYVTYKWVDIEKVTHPKDQDDEFSKRLKYSNSNY